ncbi:DUF1003 domain-containing protein [Desulfitobacterium metallireducens]|uniref:Membrane protein n=1 Tax=Desulfitobacterium metallireducens DSM 15288 TaxID=871968 RepID=W0EG55_9FIRM|nr:DUF1003 domain-containing protein [Desulfitobacterium metallireducens]AHF08056.1 membrane protein [Desulfitobacterium metallireducens DSM 15288]
MDENQLKDYTKRIEMIIKEYENTIERQLDKQYLRSTKWSDRLADRIAAFGGSWKFIMLFSGFLALWIITNTVLVIGHFDPPPFILLNLVLSFIAAFQAPIIMMSQNRHAEHDKHESLIDFAINYKAEKEIDDIQQHLHRMEADIIKIKKLLENSSNPIHSR